ncbi:ferredoxin/flavodoxin-NADP+ reductase [Enterococcus sp. AZ150]|uniref:NAD(P)/FAD-dependent oxidoreductase n=1 Tax=Enterococcus sp. AZ150 TaxID=2774866 RepID=UPI003F1FC3E9
MNQVYDVMIIGGGPAGLYSSFYAGLRDLSVALFEAQPELGGKLSFYPEKMVWDIGALPPTKGKQVRTQLVEQGLTFAPDVFLDTKITTMVKQDTNFLLTDQHGKTYLGKTVLFAIGGGIISPQKLPCFIQKQIGAYIHYEFPDQHAIFNKTLVVSGGGDGAVDYALEAKDYGANVIVCYRGEALKAHEAQIKKLTQANITVFTNVVIESIDPHFQEPLMLNLRHTKTKAIQYVPCDHVLVQHGYDREADLLDTLDFQFTRQDDFYLLCEEPTKTNIPGIFAAGDIHSCVGKVNLLAGAFQDAAQAVNQIKLYLEPESTKQAMVSSHNQKFHEKNQEMLKESWAVSE